jgi:hypothetical protein
MGFCSSEAPRKILLGGRIKEPFDLGIFQYRDEGLRASGSLI